MNRLLLGWTVLFVLCLSIGRAQDDAAQAIKERYTATLASMKTAKTEADIRKMIDAMDTPEWVSVAPNGEIMTREQAIKALEPLLAIPPDQRPSPNQDFVYIGGTGPNMVAVYWVYRKADRGLVGSLVRDHWIHMAAGWRRTKHEKFFPDRPLTDNGNPVILPPVDARQ